MTTVERTRRAAWIFGALFGGLALFFMLRPAPGLDSGRLRLLQWLAASVAAAAGFCAPTLSSAVRLGGDALRTALCLLGCLSGFLTGWLLFAYGPVPSSIHVPVRPPEMQPIPDAAELRRLADRLADGGFAAQGESPHEIGSVRDSAANAILRTAEARAAHDAKADGAMRALIERNDPAPLITFLETDRERRGDELPGRTRELAALAFLTGRTGRTEEELGRLLAADADDLGAMNTLGNLRLLNGEHAAARQAYARMLEIAGRTGDSAGKAAALGNLGLLARREGDFKEAERRHREALAIHEALGISEALAADRVNLALTLASMGQLDASDALLLKALETHEELGLRAEQAGDLLNLGFNAQQRGNLPDAKTFYDRVIALCMELGNEPGIAAAKGNLAMVAELEGNLAEAAHLGREALAMEEKSGNREGIARNCLNLGIVLRKTGTGESIEEARVLLTRARDLYGMIELPERVRLARLELEHLESR